MAYNVIVPDSVKADVQRLSTRDLKWVNKMLSDNPYFGDELSGAMTGRYAIKTPGNRYRVIYSIEGNNVNIVNVSPTTK